MKKIHPIVWAFLVALLVKALATAVHSEPQIVLPLTTISTISTISTSEFDRWVEAAMTALKDPIFKDINVEVVAGSDQYASPISNYWRPGRDGHCDFVIDERYKVQTSRIPGLAPIGLEKQWMEVLAVHEFAHCHEAPTIPWAAVLALYDKVSNGTSEERLMADMELDRFHLRREAYADVVALAYCKLRHPEIYPLIYQAMVNFRSSTKAFDAKHSTVEYLQKAGPNLQVEGSIYETAEKVMAAL